MKVSLFIPCLVDQFMPEAGLATVRLLERLGCEVVYDARQTCCGQPFFNAGYPEKARSLAVRFLEIFKDAETIVSPSGSCVSMIKRHYSGLIRDETQRKILGRVSGAVYELTDFLVNVLKVEDAGSSFKGKIAYHPSCHLLRGLGISREPLALLRNVKGAELVVVRNGDDCCGFGGVFSLKFSELSLALSRHRLRDMKDGGADVVTACDAGCLLQMRRVIGADGLKIKTAHIAEILAYRE